MSYLVICMNPIGAWIKLRHNLDNYYTHFATRTFPLITPFFFAKHCVDVNYSSPTMWFYEALPVYVHFLRLSCLVVGNLGANSEGNNERHDPTRDIYRGVGLIQFWVIRVPRGRRGRRLLRFDPVRRIIIGATALLKPFGAVGAAEAQKAAAATEPMVGVVAGELFVVLAAYVVVAQADVVLRFAHSLERRHLPRHLRGRGECSCASAVVAAIHRLGLVAPIVCRFEFLVDGGAAQDVQRV